MVCALLASASTSQNSVWFRSRFPDASFWPLDRIDEGGVSEQVAVGCVVERLRRREEDEQ